VSAKRAGRDRLFGTGWVHVFEEDTPEGAVYRAENDAIPLSRRPRERLALERDGSAQLFAAGPDDRLIAQSATWREEGDALVVRATKGGLELRILERSADRLVVQSRRGEPGR
jgi:hypothetical protein